MDTEDITEFNGELITNVLQYVMTEYDAEYIGNVLEDDEGDDNNQNEGDQNMEVELDYLETDDYVMGEDGEYYAIIGQNGQSIYGYDVDIGYI